MSIPEATRAVIEPTEPSQSAVSEAVWRKDFDKLSDALKPCVVKIEGREYIDPKAPVDLTRPYLALVSMGYYYGWL